MSTDTSRIPVFKEKSTSGGSITSDPLDLSRCLRKTVYFKSNFAGNIYVDFYDEINQVWDQVFAEKVESGELYVNSFKDMFRRKSRVRFVKSGLGEALVYFCEIYAEGYSRSEY